MKTEIAEFIEKQHNVYVNHESNLCTTGERSDEYGWMPVPSKWIDQAERMTKIPTYVVTNDRWSRSPVVVFDGEDPICDDWINDIYQRDDNTQTREEIHDDLVDEFEAQNEKIDDCWPEHMICAVYQRKRHGHVNYKFYRYDTDGMAESLGEYDSIDECLADNE